MTYDELPKLFGELLKQRREAFNLSREQIAKELDEDEVYIKDMELGTVEPTLSQLFTIARMLRDEPWLILMDLVTTLRTESDDKVIIKTRVHDFNRIFRLGYHQGVWDFREHTATYGSFDDAMSASEMMNIDRKRKGKALLDSVLTYVRVSYSTIKEPAK